MKLSFSLSSKASSKPKITATTSINGAADHAPKQYVTEFDPTQTLPNSIPKSVIPPLENNWRPHKKMKNLHLPPRSDGNPNSLQFETESVEASADPNADKISFGLNLRQNSQEATTNGGKPMTTEQVLIQKFKDDMNRLSDDSGHDEVPVEGYGASILAGYGWSEGKGIGKNHKEDVKVKQYKKWSGREGLGYDPKIATVGKEREKKPKDVEEREKPYKAKDDFRAKVNVEKHVSRRVEKKDESRGWLRSHIHVRIISKELKGGRLYLKKGKVVDVVGPRRCDISLDETKELIQDVHQEFLETALPRRGGLVLVLDGKHKGAYGSLVEKDFDKETGLVKDSDTHHMFNVKLDQIAAYLGDPNDIGY